MIVDTSALIAVIYREHGADAIEAALLTETGLIPAPVLVELERVIFRRSAAEQKDARTIVAAALTQRIKVGDFLASEARLAVEANDEHGSRTSRDGQLNMFDLMVYAMARSRGSSILCTGNDFRNTDAIIHPASRIG